MSIKHLRVGNTGVTVYVHACRVIQVCRQPQRNGVINCESMELPLATDAPLPLRLHDGASLAFETVTFRPSERVVRIRALVSYSFDGVSGPHERLVVWGDDSSKPQRIDRVERHRRSGGDAGA